MLRGAAAAAQGRSQPDVPRSTPETLSLSGPALSRFEPEQPGLTRSRSALTHSVGLSPFLHPLTATRISDARGVVREQLQATKMEREEAAETARMKVSREDMGVTDLEEGMAMLGEALSKMSTEEHPLSKLSLQDAAVEDFASKFPGPAGVSTTRCVDLERRFLTLTKRVRGGVRPQRRSSRSCCSLRK